MKCKIMQYRHQNCKIAIIQSITKIKSKVCFKRFESINLKHSISELELDCFFFEFKKICFSNSSSSSANTIEF